MNSVTVDELVMRIEIELDKFRSEASQAEAVEKKLRESIKGTGSAADGSSKKVDGLSSKLGENSKAASKNTQSLLAAGRAFVSFFATIAGSNALQKFVTTLADANDQLGFLSKRLGMSSRDIKGMDAAISALGGSGAGALASLRSLNQGVQELVLMDNDAMLPFFNALGVGVVDASGKVRKMDDILLDMSDSLSKMDPQQAYALASAMGLDEGATNALIQGRDSLQEILDLHNQIYVSGEKEMRNSRELMRLQSYMGSQWGGLKTLIADALTPALIKMSRVVSGWLDYLNRNERTVKNVFEGMAITITVLLLPVLAKAALGVLALVSPVLATAAVVAVLAAAFGLLYDDYKTWADGGKSLFDWEMFDKYIRDTDVSVDSLSRGFVRLLTGYESIAEAQEAFTKWLKEKGIIDENGISIRGLGNAFRDLGKDIFSAVPHLKTLIEMVSAMIDGRWGDAFELAKKVPSQMAGTLMNVLGAATTHAAGAIDTALGHEAGAQGTISGALAQSFAGLKGSTGLSPDKARSIASVAEQIGMQPNDLAQIISFETGGTFSPNARNPRSSATGLIQKMADPDGKYYGYTRNQLGAMSFDEQMQKVVLRYFKERGFSADRKRTVAEGYEAVTGSGYRAGSEAYEKNKVWDTNGDGVIDRNEAAESSQFKAHKKDWMGLSNAANLTRNNGMQISPATRSPASVHVNVNKVEVNTTAQTLPEATKDGVAAGISRGNDLLNQLGGGLQ